MQVWIDKRRGEDENQTRMKLAKESDEIVIDYLKDFPRSTIREISEALDWREGNVLGSMYRIEKKFKNLLFVEKVFEDGRFKTRYSIKE